VPGRLLFFMKKLVVLVIAFVLIQQLYAQPKGCSDSIVFNKFAPTFFQNYDLSLNIAITNSQSNGQRDSADNIFLGGSYGGFSQFTSILKFNPNNNLIWAKWYKPATPTSNVQKFGQLVAMDDTANLFFTGGTVSFPFANKMLVTKLDSSGTFKWAKELFYSVNFNYYFDLETPISSGGNLFFYSPDGGITALSGAGNILWVKKYGVINPLGFKPTGLKMCALGNNSLLVCITGFTSPSGNETDPGAVHYVHFVKINGATGAVLQQQTIRCYANAGLTNVFRFYPTNLNYDAANGTALLIGLRYNITGNSSIAEQVYCKLDSNLNPIITAYISSTSVFTSGSGYDQPSFSISKKNEVAFVAHEYKGSVALTIDKLNYITVNNNLQITAQRKIDYSLFGFPAFDVKTNIGFKKDGTLNFQSCSWVNGGVGFLPQTLLVYDHIPFYNNLSPCLGYDTTFFTSVPAYAQTVTALNYQETANITATVTNIVPDGLPLQNYDLPKTEICKQVSICDTIKLTGNNFYCLTNPSASFKLVRNPLCKRVTNWLVDSNYIKVLAKTDTSLNVQLLSAYNGFIKVNFAGCTLSDSLRITVAAPPTNGLNLGNDITACPGTPVSLHAGTGFKTYLWQDNSTLESFTTAQPGKYYVAATDSCGKVYSDTVLINEPPKILPYLGKDTMYCPGKIITLSAGAGYKKYVWQDNSTAANFTAEQPGKYYVTVTDSCNRLLSDTIIVQPRDVALAVNYPFELCTWDTAVINLSTLFTNYTWQPFNSSKINFNNQLLLYPGVTTTYSISGQRPAGCLLQDTVLIKTKICPDYIFFPNAFTPNGDGINDTYKPFSSGRIILYEFTIYNRYGQIVFKSNMPDKAWDGTLKNSDKPLTGSFVWFCRYQFFNQPAVQKKGICILIR
jgi:gliding motility-associated-like protein